MFQGIAETSAELQFVGEQLAEFFWQGFCGRPFLLSYWFVEDSTDKLLPIVVIGLYRSLAITWKKNGDTLTLFFEARQKEEDEDGDRNTLTLPLGIGFSFESGSVVITNFRERGPEDYPLSVSLYIRLC